MYTNISKNNFDFYEIRMYVFWSIYLNQLTENVDARNEFVEFFVAFNFEFG